MVVAVAGTLALVVAAVVAVVALRPPPHSTEPVVIPQFLLGMPVSPYDFAQDGWADGWELDGTVGGRAYRSGANTGPQLNLIVARQDITGDDDPGDVGMAGDVEERFAAVSCTQQVDYSNSDPDDLPEGMPALPPGRSDFMLICWRSRDDLTVSVLLLGRDRAGLGSADVAAAVEEAWALQG
ncbi:hypothetical protein GCM10028777_16310 [Angustibacter speluncae]